MMNVWVPFGLFLAHWVLITFTSIFCCLITTAIYNIYFSPLAQFPGPFWAKISGIPSFYYATTGRRHIWIWQCHQIYGNAFRFHPNGVLFTSPTSYPSIYGSKANVKKGRFYEIWTRNEKGINTLGTVDKMVHARKRRILNSVFSERAVRSSESFIIKHVDRWCDILEEDTKNGWTEPKNMSVLSEALVFDIMGELSFGASFDIKEKKENPFKSIPHSIAEYMQFMYPISLSPILNLWLWMKPRGLDKAFEKITPKEIADFYNFVDASVAKRSKEEEEAQRLGLDETSVRKDMFHYLYNAKDPETGKPAYSPDELNAEANLLIIAGADTTSTSLCSFLFYLSQNPRIYQKAVDEIRSTFDSIDEIRGGTKLSSCQYIRACLDEAMRMTPAGTSELIREVLPGGIEVDGQFIPEGVMVGIAHWAVLHSEENYGDPSTYRPERWIVDHANGVSEEDVALARSTFQPFSMGPGNCVGQKLAILELLITIARLFYRMDVRPAPGTTLGHGSSKLGWGMRRQDHFHVKDAYIAIKDGPLLQFKTKAT